MEIRILGPLDVRTGSRPVLVAGARQRALLACLAKRPNAVVSTDRLMEDLWGEAPPHGVANALQAAVSRLRRSLTAPGNRPPAPRILARASGYVLETDPESIDAYRFERLTAEGRQSLAVGDPAKASELLGEALALWRGTPLAEFTYEHFANAEIARLEELRVGVVEDRVEADLELGRHKDVVGALEPFVAANPFRERLRAQLILALYRSGRQAEALDVYRAGRKMLSDELGLDPSPELKELEARILRQDRSLLTSQRLATSPAGDPDVRYRSLVEAIPAITYLEHANPKAPRESRFAFVSPQIEQVLGFTPDEATSDRHFFERTLHADDLPRVLEANARAESTEEPYDEEFRQLTKDGRIRWMHDRAVLVRDHDGIPSFWHGVTIEITDPSGPSETFDGSRSGFGLAEST